MKINEYFKQKLILLGLRIKQLREERNLTIKDVALKTGIRIQYLQKIEKGLACGVLYLNINYYKKKVRIFFLTSVVVIFILLFYIEPWKVLEITSSCCSLVSLMKLTAYPETLTVS